MDKSTAKEIVREEWSAQGDCASCGWHASPAEYDLDMDMHINDEKQRIELPCRNKDVDTWDHRGVRIYY